MKKQVVLLAALIVALISFGSCKKQDDENKPLSEKLFGKWTVEKIVVNTQNSNGTAISTTTNFGPTDYMDFKKTENLDVEVKLGQNTSLGTYTTTVYQTMFLTLSTKSLACTIDNISSNKLQFTGTVTNATVPTTETYYLYR
jgi:hypothetical protein